MNKLVKNVDVESWRELKLEASKHNMNLGKFLSFLVKEHKQKGKMIPLFDLITASCAISNNAVLITLDNHFKNLIELKKIIL
ncbi:hypothetical protein HYV79_05295 [Candidatus Woesearchaeota archaeon]|nr:hypothetical protein [Candidatus Woesearchaeota archaeon]